MNQDEINRSEWQKPENWTSGSKWLCVYFSHADSRITVPKRIPSHGWTLNLAKPRGVAWLLVCILGPLVLTILIYLVIFVISWLMHLSIGLGLIYAAGGATVLLALIWIVLLVWSSGLLGIS
jgi:hypothetical protein